MTNFNDMPEFRGDKIKAQLRVGMSVTFGKGLDKTPAVVTKINKVNVKVRTSAPKGNHPAGTTWTVSPGLIDISDETFKVPTQKEVDTEKAFALMRKHGITTLTLEY